jgi:hypothetical protein
MSAGTQGRAVRCLRRRPTETVVYPQYFLLPIPRERSVATGLASTNTIPMLRQTVHARTLEPAQLITTASRRRHHRGLPGVGNAAKEKAMKVILFAA